MIPLQYEAQCYQLGRQHAGWLWTMLALTLVSGCEQLEADALSDAEASQATRPTTEHAPLRQIAGDGVDASWGSLAGGVTQRERPHTVRQFVMAVDRSWSLSKTGIYNPWFDAALPVGETNPAVLYVDVEYLEARPAASSCGQSICELLSAEVNVNTPAFVLDQPPEEDWRWQLLRHDIWGVGTDSDVPWWTNASAPPHGFGEGIKRLVIGEGGFQMLNDNLAEDVPLVFPGTRVDGLYRSSEALEHAIALFDSQQFEALRALMLSLSCYNSRTPATDPSLCRWPQSAYANNSASRCNGCHAAANTSTLNAAETAMLYGNEPERMPACVVTVTGGADLQVLPPMALQAEPSQPQFVPPTRVTHRSDRLEAQVAKRLQQERRLRLTDPGGTYPIASIATSRVEERRSGFVIGGRGVTSPPELNANDVPPAAAGATSHVANNAGYPWSVPVTSTPDP